MYILQIEHPVPNYDGWRKAFENDPIDRKGSGVQHYRISRKTDDRNYVIVDLEFDTLTDAEACHAKLHQLWSRVEGSVMNNAQSRIIEVIEDETIY
jgi:ribose 5-phosphate isomerase